MITSYYVNVKILTLLCLNCMQIMFVFYVQLIYSYYVQKHVKIISPKIKQFFVRMKTSHFIFQGLKSNFNVFIGTKNLFNPNFFNGKMNYI